MPFMSFQDQLGAMRQGLARMRTALASAVARFGVDMRREQQAIRQAPVRRRPRYWHPTRVPPMRMGRPVPHPLRVPRPVRFGQPRTVLSQRRAMYGRPAIAVAVEGEAERAAGIVRRGLLGLRRGLSGLHARMRSASRLATLATRPRLQRGVR